jgi:phosphatidylglycerophosphatase C
MAALCDFDGTLVEGDTMWSFVLALAYRRPLRGFALLAWAPVAALPWCLGLGPRRILSVALWLLTVGRGRRRNAELLREHGRRIARAARHRPISVVVERRLDHHRRGDEIWIVSGSSPTWIAIALRHHGVPYSRIVGSRLRFFAGGLIVSERCVGPDKPRRIEAAAAGQVIEWTHAYGNEPSDLPMMALARHRWMVAADSSLVSPDRARSSRSSRPGSDPPPPSRPKPTPRSCC